jgi:hypothetical protein
MTTFIQSVLSQFIRIIYTNYSIVFVLVIDCAATKAYQASPVGHTIQKAVPAIDLFAAAAAASYKLNQCYPLPFLFLVKKWQSPIHYMIK